MNKNTNTNVMACGACAVIVDQNGTTTSSVDMLVAGAKRFFSKRDRREAAGRVTASAHL